MPRSQNSPIRLYFVNQSSEEGPNGLPVVESQCKACSRCIKGNHASNMERHVRRSHPEIYEKYLGLKQKAFDPVKRHYELGMVDKQDFEDCDLTVEPSEFLKVKKMKTVATKKRGSSTSVLLSYTQNIINACIELVTTNGRPLCLMNDSGFKTLMDIALTVVHPPLTVNEDSVKKWVTEKATKLKSVIKQEVNKIVVSAKVDIWTHCNRSFMGISIYWYNNGVVSSYMLSIVEISVRQESNDFNDIFWRELSKFGISPAQVYCVVVDSGSNVIETVENVGEEDCFSSWQNNIDISDITMNPTATNFGNYPANAKIKHEFSVGEAGEGTVQVITLFNDPEEDDSDLDSSTTDVIVEKLHFEDMDDSRVLFDMKCISDTLQWAVNDSLKSSDETISLIKEIRSIYQKLSIITDKSRANSSASPLISFSKWKSLYVVLEKLQNWKKIGVVYDDVNFWKEVEMLLTVLKPCKMTSDILQKEHVAVGDVYKLWFNCILETSKINFPFAKTLADCMRERQEALFKNHIFLAAVFLDPRFNNMILKEEQKEAAIQHLLKVHQKFTSPRDNAGFQIDSGVCEEEVDELERIFQQKENCQSKDAEKKTFAYTELILKSFCESEPRLKTTENITNFWEKKKMQYPDVYNLASVVFSAPATQKSVSTVISQAQYAVTVDLSHTNQELFNDIVLLRSNPESDI